MNKVAPTPLPVNLDHTKLDPRIARSRRAVVDALMELLARGYAFEQITVTELASRANVTRRTFYMHFPSTDAVVIAMAMELFESTLATIDDEHFRLPLAESALGKAVFQNLSDRLDRLAPLVTRCPSVLFLEPARIAVQNTIFSRVSRVNRLGTLNDFESTYLSSLASSMMHGAITTWANRQFKDRPEDVAEFVMNMIAPAADRIFMAAQPIHAAPAAQD
jgi:AcrR family transcriptional regulator